MDEDKIKEILDDKQEQKQEQKQKKSFWNNKKTVKGKALSAWLIAMITIFMLFIFGLGIFLGKELFAKKESDNSNKEKSSTKEDIDKELRVRNFEDITDKLDKEDNVAINDNILLINNKILIDQTKENAKIKKIYGINDYYVVLVKYEGKPYDSSEPIESEENLDGAVAIVYRKDGSFYQSFRYFDDHIVLDPARLDEVGAGSNSLYVYGSMEVNGYVKADLIDEQGYPYERNTLIELCDKDKMAKTNISGDSIASQRYQLTFGENDGSFVLKPSELNNEKTTLSELIDRRCN